MNKVKRFKNFSIDAVVITIGTAIYAIAVTVFITPNEISPGGVTGIATILNHLTEFPTGTAVIVLNIPLLVWGIWKIGAKFLYKTIAATILSAVFIDIFAIVLPTYLGNRLLAALYGGAIAGFGLALVFLRGGSTGGTDIAAKIINQSHPFLSIGRMMLGLDFFVIALAAITYRNIETALYTVIMIFVSSRVIDSIIYGSDKGKLAFIVSNQSEKLTVEIMKDLQRGVTILTGKGAFSGNEKNVILCAVRISEAARLHSIVKNVDPNAFMIMSEVGEIIGEGFKKI